MRTVHFVYDCYLPESQQKLLGNNAHGIMRNLTKFRNRRNGPGFLQAVKDYNAVLRKLKENGDMARNAKALRHPNYELTCHILYQVYSRTVARNAEALNNYKGEAEMKRKKVKGQEHAVADTIWR